MKTSDLNQPAVWLFKAVILGFFLYALFSCSAYKQAERELCTPNPYYHKIIWCDYDYIYTEDGLKIRNIDHELFFVNDYLIDKFYND